MFSSGGPRVRFLTRYDGEVSEPVVGRQGSRVSMRVARGSASLLPSHGRGMWPRDIDGKEYEVGCTVRGKGTNLISYTLANKNSNFIVPAEELSFDKEVTGDDGKTYCHVTNVSLQQALNARMSDVDVLAVTGVRMILLSDAQ